VFHVSIWEVEIVFGGLISEFCGPPIEGMEGG